MYKCSLNLNDAFNIVRSRKSNIAPNFHFMEQLHNFERELKLDVHSENPNKVLEQIRRQTISHRSTNPSSSKNRNHNTCQQCGNDCKCSQTPSTGRSEYLSPIGQIGVSPDSGIEFDRWGSGTPGE